MGNASPSFRRSALFADSTFDHFQTRPFSRAQPLPIFRLNLFLAFNLRLAPTQPFCDSRFNEYFLIGKVMSFSDFLILMFEKLENCFLFFLFPFNKEMRVQSKNLFSIIVYSIYTDLYSEHTQLDGQASCV